MLPGAVPDVETLADERADEGAGEGAEEGVEEGVVMAGPLYGESVVPVAGILGEYGVSAPQLVSSRCPVAPRLCVGG